MKIVFADANYFVALLVSDDRYTELAKEFWTAYAGRLVTTTAVLTEVGNYLSRSMLRQDFVEFVKLLQASPRVEIVVEDVNLWGQSLNLYAARSDKFWSLTDCLSFIVMQYRGITEALTADHHFEQAGFTILLK